MLLNTSMHQHALVGWCLHVVPAPVPCFSVRIGGSGETNIDTHRTPYRTIIVVSHKKQPVIKLKHYNMHTLCIVLLVLDRIQ